MRSPWALLVCTLLDTGAFCLGGTCDKKSTIGRGRTRLASDLPGKTTYVEKCTSQKQGSR